MNYKVFYKNIEVAEFESLRDAHNYICSQLKNDANLNINNFSIYGKID